MTKAPPVLGLSGRLGIGVAGGARPTGANRPGTLASRHPKWRMFYCDGPRGPAARAEGPLYTGATPRCCRGAVDRRQCPAAGVSPLPLAQRALLAGGLSARIMKFKRPVSANHPKGQPPPE